MENALLGLAVLACPVGMGLMMWFMSKGTRGGRTARDESRGVRELRAEHERLGREIERLEGTAEHEPRPAPSVR